MKTTFVLLIFGLVFDPSFSIAEQIKLPWGKSPSGGVNFTVQGIENVPDLYGDIINPDLVIFFGGNEFMVVPELLEKFKSRHPQYSRIFAETLPPGIIEEQLAKGSLVVGNLKIEIKPDVYTGGEKRIEKLQKEGWLNSSVPYSKNKLALMVGADNPLSIKKLNDLKNEKIRISMPGQTEDIQKKVQESLKKAGGEELIKKVMDDKVKSGETFLTAIHHRQTPLRIIAKESDVGPVWVTEALFQKSLKNPIDMVEIPQDQNISSTSMAAIVNNAPHQKAAKDFLNFLTSDEARSIFKKYGFSIPD
jgi:molybdate transport system substrate-binding protein